MTRDEKLTLLREWKQRHDDLDKQWGRLASLTGGLTDSPLGDAMWLLWDAYTNQVAERVGDTYGWLSWYQLENDMGKRKHEAGPTDRMRKIKSLRDLLWVIEATA
jgi:hypothetical protein